MKKAIWIWLILSLMVPAAAAQSPQAAFIAANNLYESGSYERALDAYSALVPEITHWKIHFNMGNCLFKLERFVQAKVHYLRARRLAPSQRDIHRNLELVNQRLGDSAQAPKPGFLAAMWFRFLNALPLSLVSLLLILSVTGLNACLILILLRGKSKWRLYGFMLLVVMSLLLAGVRGIRSQQLERHDSAVVVQPRAQLRSGPGSGNTVLFTLRPGLEVRILERREQWVQVTASDEIAGWIAMEAIEVI